MSKGKQAQLESIHKVFRSPTPGGQRKKKTQEQGEVKEEQQLQALTPAWISMVRCSVDLASSAAG